VPTASSVLLPENRFDSVVASGNTIALVSVVVTGTTAVLAPVVATWREAARERRRFSQERASGDLGELRTLLDGTAALLGDVISTLEISEGLAPEERFRLLLRYRRALLRDSGRIAVRLGSNDRALLAVTDATFAVERLVPLLDPASRETGIVDAILEAYQDFDSAREGFYDAAQLLVGSRVERWEDPFERDPTMRQRVGDAIWRWRRARGQTERD
jgi:hypothetical protein